MSTYVFFNVPAYGTIKEQETTAKRVLDLHLGLVPDRTHLTVEVLREAVRTVYQDESIRRSVHDIKNAIRQAGGYLGATDVIVAFQQ
jgi:UDP:flavonoid glycosyltransferase YjiC (YdhE family)